MLIICKSLYPVCALLFHLKMMCSSVPKLFNDILVQLTVTTLAGIVKYWNNQFAGEIKKMLNKNSRIKSSLKNVLLYVGTSGYSIIDKKKS